MHIFRQGGEDRNFNWKWKYYRGKFRNETNRERLNTLDTLKFDHDRLFRDYYELCYIFEILKILNGII